MMAAKIVVVRTNSSRCRGRGDGGGGVGTNKIMPLPALGLCVILLSLASPGEAIYLGPKLSHMVVDGVTGVVFVGGENHLYQLDSELNLFVDVKTGPRNDSTKCFPPPGFCYANRTATNNYNKVLVVDSQRRYLITCGSVFQGSCEARSLTNASRVLHTPEGTNMKNSAVAANTANASTVAFIAPGPPALMGTVLYVATTYTGTSRENRVFRDVVPAISTRSLQEHNRFSLAQVDNNFLKGRQSALFLKSEIASTYPIDYVHGFSSGGFSYFLTVQRDTVNLQNRGKKTTKIIQICQEDSFFFSYADIPLRCVKNGVDYNVLETARLFFPGSELAQDMFAGRIPGDSLVGVFSRTDPEWKTVDSAICVYSMKEIRQKFLENIKLCHQGNSSVSGGGYLRVGPRGNCNHQ
ncbi:plexin-B, partial [Aplysia californica]|uniref:Plexin-B n=1 Tax=Aplysia californica TaxID=6500 RepID=A0ABM0K506_APLCA